MSGGRVVQRQVLYLGEINDSQREVWRKTIEVFEDGEPQPRTMALFPEDRPVEIHDDDVVQIRLKDLELHRPRRVLGEAVGTQPQGNTLGLDHPGIELLPAARSG